MSEEQPSRRSRVCAIRCRLFLLGYSSNIGYSLAYAFRPASGTAYSSNPRAPSPRVPPGATCARPAMRDKRSHVRRPALNTIFAARRGRQNRRAGLYVSVESLGRSSLMGGGSLFPPGAFRLLPFRRKALQPLSLAPAAHARPYALTLIPPGFVLPMVALAPPRFSNARASLLPALSLPCGARYARPYANAFPPPCGLRCAPPTPRKPACGEYEKGGRRVSFRRPTQENNPPPVNYIRLRRTCSPLRGNKKLLCVDYLAIYATLPRYVLRIVVYIDTETGVCK